MTQIDFYQLSDSAPSSLVDGAMRLVRKAYGRGLHIFVHVADDARARELDQQLWADSATSFYPHRICRSLDDYDPITISTGEPPHGHHQVYLNLSQKVPPGYARFERLLEIIPAEHSARDHARKLYAHYKRKGYPLKVHTI